MKDVTGRDRPGLSQRKIHAADGLTVNIPGRRHSEKVSPKKLAGFYAATQPQNAAAP
jgi:hypothetical protein